MQSLSEIPSTLCFSLVYKKKRKVCCCGRVYCCSPNSHPLLPENYAFPPVVIDLQHPTLCMGFPGGSAGKESACNTGDLGLIPELGWSRGEAKGCADSNSHPTVKLDRVTCSGQWSVWEHDMEDMPPSLYSPVTLSPFAQNQRVQDRGCFSKLEDAGTFRANP